MLLLRLQFFCQHILIPKRNFLLPLLLLSFFLSFFLLHPYFWYSSFFCCLFNFFLSFFLSSFFFLSFFLVSNPPKISIASPSLFSSSGQISGQKVNPKYMISHLPLKSASVRTLPVWSVSVNGPPMAGSPALPVVGLCFSLRAAALRGREGGGGGGGEGIIIRR